MCHPAVVTVDIFCSVSTYLLSHFIASEDEIVERKFCINIVRQLSIAILSQSSKELKEQIMHQRAHYYGEIT